ncbi:hypothetical protein ACU686_20565 [Yinghuangia aomiensis]
MWGKGSMPSGRGILDQAAARLLIEAVNRAEAGPVLRLVLPSMTSAVVPSIVWPR